MEIAEHVEHIRRDGALLTDAAERAGLDATVPPCPEWVVRDLVRHQGDIHRWAAANLVRANSEPMSDDESGACLLTWPDEDDGLLSWFRDGHAALVKTLETVSDDAVAFTFLAAPSARAFWARRQAHETAIHRADAESAIGLITPYDAGFAADGIDELVRGFASWPGRVTSDPAKTLSVVGEDSGRMWFITIGPEGITVADGGTNADCTVRGTTSDLYLLVWNRRSADGLDLDGNRGVLDHFGVVHKVRWTGKTRK